MKALEKVANVTVALSLLAANGASLSGECIAVSPSWLKDRAHWVFAGRLTQKKPLEEGAFQLSFEVSRVWKGELVNTAVLYQVPSLDSVRLVEGEEYVVFAQPLKQEHRRAFGLTPSVAAFVVPDCSGAMEMRENDKEVRKLGRSRRPK